MVCLLVRQIAQLEGCFCECGKQDPGVHFVQSNSRNTAEETGLHGWIIAVCLQIPHGSSRRG